MKRLLAVTLILCLLTASVSASGDRGVFGQTKEAADAAETVQTAPEDTAQIEEAAESEDAAAGDAVSEPENAVAEGTYQVDPDAAPAVYEDNLVTSQQSTVIRGKRVNYTATAGTMVLQSGQGDCEIFFTAYTLDGEDPSGRPVTFAFNGGPGSASLWMHMGFLGPRRIALDETGNATQFPPAIGDNENSILDMTDLVFIDPVGAGYSRTLPGTEEGNYLGYYNDVASVGDFIRQYVNRYDRWSSPKYLAGESYGTARAVGVCEYMHDTYGLGLNGLMLVSSINDYSTIMSGGQNDLPYALYLPTYAATAWYHGLLGKNYQDMELEDYLNVVREYAQTDYLAALFQGSRLSERERDTVAKRLAAFTGLEEDDILRQNLRVPLEAFCATLLADEGLTVGRCDGRITGPVTGGNLADGSADPSYASEDILFASAFNDYVTRELGFRTDRPYIPLSMDVNCNWSYDCDNSYLAQEKTIYDSMSKNSYLRVWVLCGYYDLATPFSSAEYVYSHLFLSADRQENLQFTYYPSGHMFYLDGSSFDQFRADAEMWYLGDTAAEN